MPSSNWGISASVASFSFAGAVLFLLAGVVVWAPPVFGQDRLPIFDTHLHYSRDAWLEYPPRIVQQKLDAAHVVRALVSSSPDDGSLTLHGEDPDRFSPVLRPYRAGVNLSNWTQDAATPDYIAGRLKRGIYKGIGELHLQGSDEAATPVMRKVARMAVEHGILLHVHSYAAPVGKLFELEPELTILWAHAGFEAPETVRRMVEKHPRLFVEFSFRSGEILGDGGAIPENWKRLLSDHTDRFMIGTDTYRSFRWEGYGELVEGHRRWLALMPPEMAKAIAFRNAARLFGAGKRLPQ